MAKKDVLDTVDIFFGTGKATTPEPETKQLQQEISAELDRLEAELSPLQAKAERRAAARNRTDGGRKRPAASASARPRPNRSTENRVLTDTTGAAEETEQTAPERERISFVLPYEQVEYLKNYKYCRALMDGDPQYTLTEALIEAIELLRKHSTYDVFERPDFVRAREKKPRRR